MLDNLGEKLGKPWGKKRKSDLGELSHVDPEHLVKKASDEKGFKLVYATMNTTRMRPRT